jgi:predicted nucleotidyltransferase
MSDLNHWASPALTARSALAVREFVERVRAALGSNVVEFRLFGSHARGDDRPGSDIDIALLVHGDRRGAEDTAVDIAFDVNVAHDVYISPRVIERHVLDDPVWRATAFLQALEREGVTL